MLVVVEYHVGPSTPIAHAKLKQSQLFDVVAFMELTTLCKIEAVQ